MSSIPVQSEDVTMSGMPAFPRPPAETQSVENFENHVRENPAAWYKFYQEIDQYIRLVDPYARNLEQTERVNRQELEKLRLEYSKLEAIQAYQHEMLLNQQRSSHQNSPAPPPAPDTRLSERLPDPDKFEGDRKDFRRFASQIHEKMTVNRDRFPTPQSRMTYVTNRLKGAPYAQILPYIHKGICHLNDYDEILKILDNAFGDPNRRFNARSQLLQLRQNNKDFSTYFAEFQRLALESEMVEAALPSLLENGINAELRGMLMHSEPPEADMEYHAFAAYLQKLENRRKHYQSRGLPPKQPRAPYANNRVNPNNSFHNPAPSPAAPAPVQTPLPAGEPMDLSSYRRGPTRRERGECFRCGASDHHVRNCKLPDTRPLQFRSTTVEHSFASSPIRSGWPVSSPPRGRPLVRDSSPVRSDSPKDMSLV